MIAFEGSYLTAWRNSFEEAKHGFKEHLLTKNESRFLFSVNANET
jgi:hypothetical protein